MNSDRLSWWEKNLLNDIPLNNAVATFTRTDGRTVVLHNVNPDSIGPSAANPGVVAVEFEDVLDRVVHLPFIESWEIDYR